MVTSRPRSLVAVNPTGMFSGAEWVLSQMLQAAHASGWNVSLYAPPGPLAERMHENGIRTGEIPELKPGSGPRALAVGRLGIEQARVARRLRSATKSADLVLVNGLMALPAVALARVGAPVCWYVHDVVVRRDLRAVARFSAHAVDHAITPSRASAAFPSSLGIDVTISPNGTSVETSPVEIPSAEAAARARPTVGVSAALTEWKGQHVLLEAMARVPDVDVELMGPTFPGDADYAAALERRAASPDLEGRVRFLGRIEQPKEQMRHWDISVVASIEPEAGSLVLLEAMSLGLPIVASDQGCIADYLDDAGVVVESGDPAAMAGAITVLLADPERRAQLGARARQRIERQFTIEQSRERFLRAIDSFAAERRVT